MQLQWIIVQIALFIFARVFLDIPHNTILFYFSVYNRCFQEIKNVFSPLAVIFSHLTFLSLLISCCCLHCWVCEPYLEALFQCSFLLIPLALSLRGFFYWLTIFLLLIHIFCFFCLLCNFFYRIAHILNFLFWVLDFVVFLQVVSVFWHIAATIWVIPIFAFELWRAILV